jgi:WXG100 family type VII secretion target
MTKDIINIHYSTAIKQAKELENVASSLRNSVINSMTSEIGTLSAGWKGSASCTAVSKSNAIIEQMRESAGRIESIAQKIRSTAEAVRSTEEQQLAAEEGARSAPASADGNGIGASCGGGSAGGDNGGGSF